MPSRCPPASGAGSWTDRIGEEGRRRRQRPRRERPDDLQLAQAELIDRGEQPGLRREELAEHRAARQRIAVLQVELLDRRQKTRIELASAIHPFTYRIIG